MNGFVYINFVKLDAVFRGISLAVSWDYLRFVLVTDSATVSGWLEIVFDRTYNVKNKDLNEPLIRRCLDILCEVAFRVPVRLVPSHPDKPNRWTRFPKRELSIQRSQASAEVGVVWGRVQPLHCLI